MSSPWAHPFPPMQQPEHFNFPLVCMFGLKYLISRKDNVSSTNYLHAPAEQNEEELWGPGPVVLKPHPLLILYDCHLSSSVRWR